MKTEHHTEDSCGIFIIPCDVLESASGIHNRSHLRALLCDSVRCESNVFVATSNLPNGIRCEHRWQYSCSKSEKGTKNT
eukprot:1078501-Amphidinium_carterae.1